MLDRTEKPRMPWQDVQCLVTGLAAYDVARNFIERWNHVVKDTGDTTKDMLTHLSVEDSMYEFAPLYWFS